MILIWILNYPSCQINDFFLLLYFLADGQRKHQFKWSLSGHFSLQHHYLGFWMCNPHESIFRWGIGKGKKIGVSGSGIFYSGSGKHHQHKQKKISHYDHMVPQCQLQARGVFFLKMRGTLQEKWSCDIYNSCLIFYGKLLVIMANNRRRG